MAGRSFADRLMLPLARAHAVRVFDRFIRDTQNIVAVQQRVLSEKLQANADSAYGRDFGFKHTRTYTDFIRHVPITAYEDLVPYVERVKQGETSAMFGHGQRVLMFALTSGSTAEPKYVPVTEKFLANYRRGWNAFGVRALSDHPGTMLRHIVQVSSPMDEQRSPSGVPCGAITGIMAATQKRLVRKYYAAPPCVAHIGDATARYYTIMRLALPKDVGFMITANPATQLKLVRTVEAHADRMIRDIRDGTLDPALPVAPEIRAALASQLRPAPRTAQHLETIRARTGRLLPKDYWNLGFLANWTGGTMGLYLQQFPEYFGDTPVRDVGLLASEGRMSIPITDGTPAGILDVSGNFYEFIPAEEADRSNPTVLRAHEVAAGREYEILLTTDAGFYRYRIGDVVRVVGFFGPTPLIEFLHKGANTCSLTGEKLTERQVVLAFEQIRRESVLAAADFVLAPHWADPPYYVLHVDTKKGAGTFSADRMPPTGDQTTEKVPAPFFAGDPFLARELAGRMDNALRQVNIEYASKRDTQRLGPVRVNLLPDGYLAGMHARLSARRRAANEQYKPRYLYRQPGDDAEFPTSEPRP
jgi:hypothetical protein